MKKGYRHILLIVDESGSMCNAREDTIGGIKSLVKKQAEDAPDGTISTVFFDTYNGVRTIQSFDKLSEVNLNTYDRYSPTGMTNLLDAIGLCIDTTGKKLEQLAEEDRPESVMVCILTDGVENASREYSAAMVKDLIKHQEEKYNWDFSFISEDLSALEQARDYGFAEGNMALYSKGSTDATFDALSCKVSRAASGGDSAFTTLEASAMVGDD